MRDLQLIKQLHKTFTEKLRRRKVQVLSHWGGDADSVGSSYVLSRLLLKVYEASEVGFLVPEERSSHVEAIMQHLGLEEKYIHHPDVYLLVDVGSLNQLGSMRDIVVNSGKPIISVDHHLPQEPYTNLTAIASPKYLAVSEIVYDLIEYLGIDIEKQEAEALFLGIYYDTVRLSVADEEAARKTANLLACLNPSQIIGLLEQKMEEPERVARLKALKRTNIFKVGEWYVAVSTVNSYLSAVARMLINAGAQVALVGASQEGMAVVSLRSSPEFQKYAGISLGDDLMKHMLRRFEGDGGGHAGAARMRLKTSVETALNESVKGLAMLLGASIVELAS